MRKAISKKLRFDVFKRDSFKCQYCGRSAPDVILNVDHVVAVANDGDNGVQIDDIKSLARKCQNWTDFRRRYRTW